MKYCSRCEAEYEDTVTRCADCDGTEFRPGESPRERREQARMLASEADTRRFALAGTAEDPLMAQSIKELLSARHIAVFVRSRAQSPVDALTTGTPTPYWEFLVPEEQVSQARELIDAEQRRIAESADENASVAEEEELSSEKQ